MEEMIIAPQINFIVRELIKLSYFNYTFKPIGHVTGCIYQKVCYRPA